MAATLDDMVKMGGVIMAFEFTPEGKYTAYRNLSPEMTAMAARCCATVTMEFNTLAGAFSTLSERQWIPQHGWTCRDGDHTVIIGNGGYRGVFVETAKASLNELFKALIQSRDASG